MPKESDITIRGGRHHIVYFRWMKVPFREMFKLLHLADLFDVDADFTIIDDRHQS